MFTRKYGFGKITTIVVTLFIILLFVAIYLYFKNSGLLSNIPPSNSSSTASKVEQLPTPTSTTMFEEPPSGVSVEKFSSGSALVITGKVTDKPYLMDDGYYYTNIKYDEGNQTNIKVLLGKADFPVGKRFLSPAKDKQINEMKKLSEIILDMIEGKTVSLYIYFDNAVDVNDAAKQDEACDTGCKEFLDLELNRQENNKDIADNFKKGWQDSFIPGPVGLVQIHEN